MSHVVLLKFGVKCSASVGGGKVVGREGEWEGWGGRKSEGEWEGEGERGREKLKERERARDTFLLDKRHSPLFLLVLFRGGERWSSWWTPHSGDKGRA